MKRLLIVDDEEDALAALRCRLQRMSDWAIDCAVSGPLALELMERQPYDVIVTDLRMPGMDGAGLLQITSERWPQTVRIVLSGYADPSQTARLVPFAHQYLSKPCEPRLLEDVIDRCLLLQNLLGAAPLRAVVGRIRKLPTVPRIYAALQKVLQDENATAADVAGLVTEDPVIAARILQVVNSAFFRLARRVTNIEQAVSYLGFSAIRNIAASVEIFSQWGACEAGPLVPAALQMHVGAVVAAVAALTVKTPIADDALLAALLHDIGYWILAQECAADLSSAVALARAAEMPLYEAEKQVLGASHAELGAYLLGIWGLPYPVIEAVAHHHEPQHISQTSYDVLAALSVGHSLASSDETCGFNVALPAEARIDQAYLTRVAAPFDWIEAQRRVAATIGPTEAFP